MMRYTLLLLGMTLSTWTGVHGADLTGLWKVSAIKNVTTGKAEPALRQYHTFTNSHHLIVLAGENRPKVEKSFADMTAEEVMSQMPVGAGFYRYRQEGEVLIRTNVIALSAHYEGKTFRTRFTLKDDTLVLRDRHAADGDLREWTLKRVE